MDRHFLERLTPADSVGCDGKKHEGASVTHEC
jgi:hypothetical protein